MQKPQSVACGDPVVAEVFRIAKAGHDTVSRGQLFRHFFYVVFLQQIVRVEDEERVILSVHTVRAHMLPQSGERVSLADLLPVLPLINDRSVRFCRDSRIIRAVVRDHVDIRRVRLGANAVEQMRQDRLLIARRDADRDMDPLPCPRGHNVRSASAPEPRKKPRQEQI